MRTNLLSHLANYPAEALHEYDRAASLCWCRMLPVNFDAMLHVHTAAAHETAETLTTAYREHARLHGVPEHICEDIAATYHPDTDTFHLGPRSAHHQEEFEDWEYGTETTAPVGFTRGFSARHAHLAPALLGDIVMRRMHG